MTSERCQIVILTLSDGRTVTYTGPEQVDITDTGYGIVGVKFTEGQPLPPGYAFEMIPGSGLIPTVRFALPCPCCDNDAVSVLACANCHGEGVTGCGGI